MHVKPLASPALAQGPQGIQRLIANAQFSLLCSIMYSEVRREWMRLISGKQLGSLTTPARSSHGKQLSIIHRHSSK